MELKNTAELSRAPERGVQSQFVPFEQMTDREKKAYRDRAQDLLKFLLYSGYRFRKERSAARNNQGAGGQGQGGGRGGAAASEIESRFAYSLLEKLLHYCQVTSAKMRNNTPSNNFTRRKSYKETSGDVKFFGKVVLPLVEQYFRSQKSYFLRPAAASVDAHGTASPKEKEMVANLFCRLALLLRLKVMSFGQDTKLAVECLQVLVQAIDCSSLIKHSLDFVRTSFLTFFNQAAHDLTNTVNQLKALNFPAARGTTPKQSTSLGYVEGVLLRVLASLFDHIGTNNFGKEILINDIQIPCYSILDSLYTLGTKSSLAANRKLFEEITVANRPLLGACLAAFASTFPVAFLEPEFNANNPCCILGRAQEQSLEAQDVMNRLSASLPTMDILVQQIEAFTASGDYGTAPHIIDVVLPMLCSYLSTWFYRGPENTHPDDTVVTKVTSEHLNTILTHVFTLILGNLGNPKATWMERIAAVVGQIVINTRTSLLEDRILPIAHKLEEHTHTAHASEEVLRCGQRLGEDLSSVEAEVGEQYALLVRDLYAFFPLVIRYTELHKLQWIKENNAQAEALYAAVSEVFNRWMRSQHFKREELNFLSANDIDVNALISAGSRGICKMLTQSNPANNSKAEAKKRKRERKEKGGEGAQQQSLIVVCLKRVLPVGLNLFTGREQELVQKVKERMLRNESEDAIEDFVKAELQLPDQPNPDDKRAWQRYLYVKIGKKKLVSGDDLVDNVEESALAVVSRILNMSKVLHGLHLVDHPPILNDTRLKLVSTQRKRAIIACFRMVSLHSLPRHRVINLFLRSYRELWLSSENVGQELLVVNLTELPEEPPKPTHATVTVCPDEDVPPTDQLTQIVTALSRAATAEQHNDQFVHLYLQYAGIMSMSCGGADEEEEEEGGDGEEEAGPAGQQEQEEERQKLLSYQNRLADRGVSEMALMYISASNGEPSDTVWATLSLGISILRGGNEGVQKRMANYLKEKRDVGFFTSMSGLMNSCGVLDLDAFERIIKAEGLGVNSEPSPTETNDENAANTCKLFRFLQLLCEGHNGEFQNYLRTQQGNTSTVNLIICTVDYLLRVQESVMDFYWHYSSKEFVDAAGIGEFVRAIKIAAQVFNTLTESIQGPCSENQLCLAHSRLWDAVGGFLFLFANMQDKLAKAKEPSQLDLLQEFLDLQNEMMTMLISMLEGNTMNGPIGKQMVDSLAESSQNLEEIIKFFDLFLKLDELVNSPGFKEFDPKHTGWITTQDLKKAMEAQKIYDAEQVAYLLSCISDQDGNIDYIEFTERYHTPAKEIGFNLSLLLTNLNEHTTKDARLLRIMEVADSMQNYFKDYLGRIEIIGSAKHVERVYFEIPASNREQWNQKQIKESKAAFLHAVVNEGDDKGKLEVFVSFCEDAIFEMQHAASISVKEPPAMLKAIPLGSDQQKTESVWTKLTKGVKAVGRGVGTVASLLTPGNVKRKYHRLKRLTYPQLALATAKAILWMFYYVIYFQIYIVKATGLTVLYMMTGYSFEPDKPKTDSASEHTVKSADMNPRSIYGLSRPDDGIPGGSGSAAPVSVFGVAIAGDGPRTEELDDADSRLVLEMAVSPMNSGPPPEPPEPARTGPILTIREGPSPSAGPLAALTDLPSPAVTRRSSHEDSSHEVVNEIGEERAEEEASVGLGWTAVIANNYTAALNLAARQFYSLQDVGLLVALMINFVLLFYKVTDAAGNDLFAKMEDADGDVTESVGGDGEEDDMEMIVLEGEYVWLPLILRLLAALHSVIAIIRLIAYYRLKVPLGIFKLEKEIARKLEFDGLYIEEMPEGMWYRWCNIVISSKSFPYYYWDKFVKKKVIKKYKETHDLTFLLTLLGEEESTDNLRAPLTWLNFWYLGPIRWVQGFDWRYPIWKAGAILGDKAFQYNLFYTLFSLAGNYNQFFFALHLLDIVTSSKSLTTILQSVTHNGKQLLLTVMMMVILVWLYTVLAFNFFRGFYVQEEEGEKDPKCHNMLTCFIFHLYNGVRNGGGIGDAISEPDGDPLEYYRIVFDIAFFFSIIVILLAIVQGLIIDAFGELRGQLEQVDIDMGSKCFICEKAKDEFDKQPRGFETHTLEEHNLANYLFFIMHLINKDQTEYTGQESYVWDMYQRRCWDFFPMGESFRITNAADLFD
ncbi:Ryanodine receptor [Hypsibius exemplaris]|uniref:Ryanodine receptor n=1 Tax=Hypsibius exemplaris TaxID=2072580 RepID=A0A1W0WNS5_HYPEX|nr:Ryanodine receptor [Hypsibius exemplaris]